MECDQLAVALYTVASLTNPRSRLPELREIQKTVADLGDGLAKFAASGNWMTNSLYRLTSVEATQAKLQKVTLKFTRLKYEATSTGVTMGTAEAGTGTFTVRRFDRFVVELGAGVITAELIAPKYGTVEKDGKQFAVKTSEQKSSWNPAVVGNFVCRCWRSAVLAPMFQFGALPSKDTPALLVGAGARIFGGSKGGFGITYGAAFAWVKRISDEDLAKPITGTADIEKNRRFVYEPAPYFMFQYQF
jgi:hypothetical protein